MAEPDPQLVERVAQAILDCDGGIVGSIWKDWVVEADAAIAAIDACGRLLLPDVEVREEWRVFGIGFDFYNEADAISNHKHNPAAVAGAPLLHRFVRVLSDGSTLTGRWVPVA